ncbi:MAG: GNAT family N-acetyltransferase [Acidimicrobiales bacterium]
MRWDGPDGYFVSDDPSLIETERVHGWLADESYWATGRSIELVRRSIERSLTLGLYTSSGEQAGICRWVTDYASFAWLCDVFVDRAHRGRRLGEFMVGVAASHDDLREIRLQLLATRDAHGLYRKFGFLDVAAERYMERRR